MAVLSNGPLVSVTGFFLNNNNKEDLFQTVAFGLASLSEHFHAVLLYVLMSN